MSKAQEANKKELEQLKAQLKAKNEEEKERRRKQIEKEKEKESRKRQIVLGSSVRINKGSVDYDGKRKLDDWAYNYKFYVGEMKGNRAVIYKTPACSGPPTAAISINDMTLI